MGRHSGGKYLNMGGNGKPMVPQLVQIRVIEFDGFKFPLDLPPQMLPVIEMAYRARRGDPNAEAVLKAWGVRLAQPDGGPDYWPVTACDRSQADEQNSAEKPVFEMVPGVDVSKIVEGVRLGDLEAISKAREVLARDDISNGLRATLDGMLEGTVECVTS